jgi:glycosyltransferase involved in cell wall biosynthesis
MRFSLIVATLGRVEQLRELFDSLLAQELNNFEVIVVDQNADDRLAWTTSTRLYEFPVIRMRSDVRHSSHARNLGLRKASGDIVAFPDDDCTYPPDLLANVDKAFRDDPALCVRTGPCVAQLGAGFSSGRWRKESGPIDIKNVWNSVIEANVFLLRSVALAIGGFDERLGVGGILGSAEGNDLVARAVREGRLGWYATTGQVMLHPDKNITEAGAKRAFVYGAGLGYALRKNKVPTQVWLNFMIRPVGGCILYLVRGESAKAAYYWHTLRGRLHGFRSYKSYGISAHPQCTEDVTSGAKVR